MIIWDEKIFFDPSRGTVEHEALVYILSALKTVSAHIFRIELNIDLPVPVSTALGSVPFDISRHRKLHDDERFPLY
jgi:hypothetical protein